MSTAQPPPPIDDLVRGFAPIPAADSIEDSGLDAARDRLDHAIAGSIAPRRPVRRRPAWRALSATASIAAVCGIALVVGVGALLGLGGRGPSGTQAKLRGPAIGKGANALIARLAVLRRPQTIADQLPRKLHLVNVVAAEPPIIPGLSRLVATPPGAKIYLVVTEPARGRGALWSPSLGDQLNIVAITRSGATTEGPAGYPAADITDPTNLFRAGFTGARGRSGNVAHRLADAYDVAIVPDGVARVRWTFSTRAGGPGRVVTAPVRNNVAITKLTPATAIALHTTWYGTDGQVIPTSSAARTRALAAINRAQRRVALAAARRSHVTATPAILHAFAVFDLDSRSGIRIAHGYVVSHPTLSQLPLSLLPGGLGHPQQLDLRDVRKVVTPSKQTLYVIPGVDTICLFVVDDTPPYGHGMSGGCTNGLATSLTHGAGETSSTNSGVRGSMVYLVLSRRVRDYRLRIGAHAFRVIHPVDGIVVAHTPFRFG